MVGEYRDGRIVLVKKNDANFKIKKIEDVLVIVNRFVFYFYYYFMLFLPDIYVGIAVNIMCLIELHAIHVMPYVMFLLPQITHYAISTGLRMITKHSPVLYVLKREKLFVLIVEKNSLSKTFYATHQFSYLSLEILSAPISCLEKW